MDKHGQVTEIPEHIKFFRGNCKSCRFWDGMHCRVTRPNAYQTRVKEAIGDSFPRWHDVILTQWPQTQSDDWCGEFKHAGDDG